MKKNKRKLKILFIVVILMLFCFIIFGLNHIFSFKKVVDDMDNIDNIVTDIMKKSYIPGLAISILDNNGEHIYTYGYNDIKKGTKITEDTLFQLGSNSKAFTAYAINKLSHQGKIDLKRSIKEYIPEFYMVYEGMHKGESICGEVEISVEQLLYHISGISEDEIVNIPEGNERDALKNTVNMLIGKKLKNYPGEYFEYSTINYDILGLIIETVSGMKYEQYMEGIFKELGLNNTTAYNIGNNIAKGYKFSFFNNVYEYSAPIYRGNVPAGYILSNIKDMSRWLNIQMKHLSITEDQEIILDNTHIPNLKNITNENTSYYASGWYVQQNTNGTLIYHSGNNPNYSSIMIFNKELDIGICVLANLNSPYTSEIGMRILGQYTGVTYDYTTQDTMKLISLLATILIIFTCVFNILIGILIYRNIKDNKKIKQNKYKISRNKIYHFIIMGIVILLVCVGGYKIPSLIYEYADWNFVSVWMPQVVIPAAILLCLTLIWFYVYYILIIIYRKKDFMYLVALLILSILSGLGNSLVIFIINIAVSGEYVFNKALFYYFLIGLFLYILGQRILRFDLIDLTSEIVYEKRKTLIKNILNMSYDKFELLDTGQIQACINSDTEILSNFANIIISAVTSIVTVICCFCYLFFMSKSGFFITAVIVIIATLMYSIVSQKANNQLEEARDCQNTFYNRIMDMIMGFKELSINKRRKNEFMEDTFETCINYKNKKQQSGKKFAQVYIIGESLFTSVIGVIVFLFPLILLGGGNKTLGEYVFILLYITGPINNILNSIPGIVQVRISWKRVKELEDKLVPSNLEVNNIIVQDNPTDFKCLSVKNVCYTYIGDGEEFKVGPLNANFKKGQITFIVGGNGSGKSTFVKLLTGLYAPNEGNILIDGKVVNRTELGEMFTAIYSDYYLFSKIYGLSISEKLKEANDFLKELCLEEKVSIKNNKFTTTNLSSGQKKRLALILSLIEDKPIFIFDEWAADQDPLFRKYFYNEIVPNLKQKGKCVIAITHDDRYFNLADQVITMEIGKISSEKQNELLYQ